MSDPLREPGFLTEHQLRAALHDSDLFLVACPGSGKTRTGGVRFARLAADGKRVAATSYTNVGVNQIRSVVSGDLGITVGPEHFVGTLHGLLLRFIVYPFGHLVMGCETAPRLIADEAGWQDVVFGGNHRIRVPLSRFRFRPDGSLCYRGRLPYGVASAEDAAASEQEQALGLKSRYAKAGYVSPDDSMYWALRVIEDHPDIAAVVASRFDELQVDEAQDTSELQLAALHGICATGALSSLVLIGDIEQSIFSFQGASRQGCRALARARGLETIELTENLRSSQRICDVAVHFCAREKPDVAVGEHADCFLAPELFLYEPEHPETAVARYRDRLRELGLPTDDAAVLGRWNALVDELNAQQAPVACEPRPLALGRAAAMIQGAGTLTRMQIQQVDRALAYTAWDTTDLAELETEQLRTLRQATIEVLANVPETRGDLAQWIRTARQAVDAAIKTLTSEPEHTAGQAFRSGKQHEGVEAAVVFAPPPRSLHAQTVHDIKGDSRDAVLVVADRPRSQRRAAQSSLWSRPLLGEEVPEDDAEELRIVFVALTRARRYCALALPADTPPERIEGFIAAGFEVTSVEVV
jgi:DNA helicase II / ATP-dependent DNA helicase PcrA